jgi:hypothetical protein
MRILSNIDEIERVLYLMSILCRHWGLNLNLIAESRSPFEILVLKIGFKCFYNEFRPLFGSIFH